MSSSPDRSANILWVLRAAWLIAPLLVGRGIMDALTDVDSTVRATVEVGLWVAWFAGLVSLLAPSAVSLTALRSIAAGAPISAALAGLLGSFSAWAVVAVGAGVCLTGLCLLPHVGAPMINGSAYGSERRMALRPPAAVLIGPIQIAWLLAYFGIVTGPLLIAAGRWVVGAVAVVVGFPLAAAGFRSLHQLSRRWLVFVPAGFVIHDYHTLAESLLFLRRTSPVLGLAPGPDLASLNADHESTDAVLDLSQNALGHPLLVEVEDALPVALRRSGTVETATARRFVFSPTLPGAALAEARLRAIRIG